jgi:DNA-directed RNA polymerase subunit RPC12/RpoP
MAKDYTIAKTVSSFHCPKCDTILQKRKTKSGCNCDFCGHVIVSKK